MPLTIHGHESPDMFLSHIVDHPNTDHGVLIAVTSACGGQAILNHGNQVAQVAPGGQIVRSA